MAPRPKFTPAAQTSSKHLKHKRRFCRIDGCARIVKSQGLCQRHGAKPRMCKVEGCEKQAQGNFDKMCKSHFKAMKRATTPLPKVDNTESPPPAEGSSVYDEVLPASINYTPTAGTMMPLVAHLKAGFDAVKPPAWHRNEERRARGLFPIDNPATQLEGWERELVWMEILVLTGAPKASFRHLARGWGRDKGFHMVLAQFICERHGDVQRKKRHGEPNNNGSSGTSGKSRKQQPNKRGVASKHKKDSPGVISADIWDDSCYGDADTNEALAAGIFNFSEQEFEAAVSSKRKENYASSDAPSSPSRDEAAPGSDTATCVAAGGASTAPLPRVAHAPRLPPSQHDGGRRGQPQGVPQSIQPNHPAVPGVAGKAYQHPAIDVRLHNPQFHHNPQTHVAPIQNTHAPAHHFTEEQQRQLEVEAEALTHLRHPDDR